ncbi:MAG: FliM/FliN family flagellar motor switch protein, partial [Polyangiaceae bacterium]
MTEDVTSLISVTATGGSTAALETMRRAGDPLALALRRAVPFLTRRGVAIKPGEPYVMNSNELESQLTAPVYLANLASEPGGARAAICLDSKAISFLLEGSLGGDGSDPPKLNAKGLTAPQLAFMDRVFTNIMKCCAETIERSIGLSVKNLPRAQGQKSAGATLVVLPLNFVDEAALDDDDDMDVFGPESTDEAPESDDEAESSSSASRGRMLIGLSKNALNRARAANDRRQRTQPIDDRVAATIREVDVDVVAELGRLPLTIGKLMALKVGDTLRLDVPVNGHIILRIDEVVLFRGQPTTAGTQLAI